MEVNISTDTVPVISVSGRMDTGNSSIFEAAVAPLMQSDTKELLVECKDLEYISSSGLRQLLMLQKNITGKGGKLQIRGLRPEIKEIFDLTGFSNILTII